MGNEIGEGTHEQSEPEPVTHVLGLGPTFVTSLRLSFVSSVVPPLRSAVPRSHSSSLSIPVGDGSDE